MSESRDFVREAGLVRGHDERDEVDALRGSLEEVFFFFVTREPPSIDRRLLMLARLRGTPWPRKFERMLKVCFDFYRRKAVDKRHRDGTSTVVHVDSCIVQ